MAPATKTEAIAKLNALYVGVGYPESWRDYSGYEVKPDDIVGNLPPRPTSSTTTSTLRASVSR